MSRRVVAGAVLVASLMALVWVGLSDSAREDIDINGNYSVEQSRYIVDNGSGVDVNASGHEPARPPPVADISPSIGARSEALPEARDPATTVGALGAMPAAPRSPGAPSAATAGGTVGEDGAYDGLSDEEVAERFRETYGEPDPEHERQMIEVRRARSLEVVERLMAGLAEQQEAAARGGDTEQAAKLGESLRRLEWRHRVLDSAPEGEAQASEGEAALEVGQ